MAKKKKLFSPILLLYITIAAVVISQGGLNGGRMAGAAIFLFLVFCILTFIVARQLYPKYGSWKRAIWESMKCNYRDTFRRW